MDYYEDNPLKVNRLVKDIKKMRKEQRKARKALKAKRMAELLAAKEQKQQHEDYPQENREKFKRFSHQDSFNWDESEVELKKENCCDDSGEDDASDFENYP